MINRHLKELFWIKMLSIYDLLVASFLHVNYSFCEYVHFYMLDVFWSSGCSTFLPVKNRICMFSKNVTLYI